MNRKPLVENSINSGLQDEAELKIVWTGSLNPKGLQSIGALPSSSSDPRLIGPSEVIEGTGLRIESVFSFSGYTCIPEEPQQTVAHWNDGIPNQDEGLSGNCDSDEPSIPDGLAQNTSASPVTHLCASAQRSPRYRPQPLDNPKLHSHPRRCLICHKTFRSLSTLHLHTKYSNMHNPSFTKYLKKVTPPFLEGAIHLYRGPAAERGESRSLSPTPCARVSRESLPAVAQPLSRAGISFAVRDCKVSSEILASSGEGEDIGLPLMDCLLNKPLATPADINGARADWLNDVPMKFNEDLDQSPFSEPDVGSYTDDIPLEVDLWSMPPCPVAQTLASSTQQPAEDASASASSQPVSIPKHHSEACWCPACQSIFTSIRALQGHAKNCQPHGLNPWACLSRGQPLPESVPRQPRCVPRGAAASRRAPAPCPARFIPMSKCFYLALAGGQHYHVCNICDLWCADERSLGLHLKVHFWRRNYHCCLCDRAFHTPSCCWRHQEKHSSHPHYRCSPCGSIFGDYAPLKEHMRNSHQVNLELTDNDTYQEAISKAATYEMIA
ncbi:uncharacterized protein [Scyliorhinus torazame]|uniref:uncharacterized protein n=1 Tax=Scyliorhinus torazame TaxID=75743 RepID=UPI003B594FFE